MISAGPSTFFCVRHGPRLVCVCACGAYLVRDRNFVIYQTHKPKTARLAKTRLKKHDRDRPRQERERRATIGTRRIVHDIYTPGEKMHSAMITPNARRIPLYIHTSYILVCVFCPSVPVAFISLPPLPPPPSVVFCFYGRRCR